MKENLTSCERKKISKQFSSHLKKVQVFQLTDDWETWLFCDGTCSLIERIAYLFRKVKKRYKNREKEE